jgi:hypothetical protein
MRRTLYGVIRASSILILVSACTLQSGSLQQDPTAAIETRVAELVASTNVAQTALAQGVSATLTVIAGDMPASNTTPEFTPTYTFTATLESSVTPTIPLTLDVPQATVSVATFCRSGPGTAYELLGTLNVGESAEVVGRSASNEFWIIKLPSNPAITCWLWGQYASLTGNAQALPVKDPPPTPLPKLVPTEVLRVLNVNLVAGTVVLDPTKPLCSQSFTVGLDVTNTGSKKTPSAGSVSAVDVRSANGHQVATAVGGFPVLQPGQTFRVNMPFTISTFYDEYHKITLTIDPSNLIPESNEGDNVSTIKYILLKGSCP